MKLLLIRDEYTAEYTGGYLSVDGVRFCETLEPARKKIFGSIPEGMYQITLNVQSPKFANVAIYREIGYKMPRLLNVPGREGILIHPGNNAIKDSAGCPLVGVRTSPGYLSNSRDTFFKLYRKMQEAVGRGENITIQIIDSMLSS